MSTTVYSEPHIVYATNPELTRFDTQDKKFATSMCLFVIISSTVLICLFFLIGEPFGFILILIIGVTAVAILIAYRMRRPAALFSLRPATSVKVPTYRVHFLVPTQPNGATDPKFYQTSPVYSSYRVETVY